jgi:transcription antitermination factor NusG
MIKLKIKSGDTVTVIAGDHKGSEGKVLRVDREKNQVQKALKEELLRKKLLSIFQTLH